jgi:hypothetical protein
MYYERGYFTFRQNHNFTVSGNIILYFTGLSRFASRLIRVTAIRASSSQSMTACSPSIVSAGCFAPVPPLVMLSAPVAASRPVALAAAFASLSSSRAFLYLPKYLRGVHGIEWEDAAPARGRRGGGREGLRASGPQGGAWGLVNGKGGGRRAARGTQQLPRPPVGPGEGGRGGWGGPGRPGRSGQLTGGEGAPRPGAFGIQAGRSCLRMS